MRALLASLLFGLIAGTCDAASFLLLHGLLTANLPGNFVLLGADWAAHRHREVLGRLIALPVFIAWTWAARTAAGELQRRGRPARPALLLAMVALLGIFVVLGVTERPFLHQDEPNTLIVGMIGVTAMAFLNVVARMWPALAAGTTAMTGNTVRLLIDLAELALGQRQEEPKLLQDSGRLALTVLAFSAGCALAALVYMAAGAWCTVLPLGFAAGIAVLSPKDAR